jgi:TPR repeat protein
MVRRLLLLCLPALAAGLVLLANITSAAAQGKPAETLSIDQVQSLAAQGDANAQNLLGSLYERGAGVDKSLGDARKWYEAAAEQGHATAQSNLGAMYWEGVGVEKNAQEGVRLFKLSADQEDAAGLNNLADAYARGEGVARDPAEALRLRKQAFTRGSANAAIILANAYSRGDGVPKDQAAALELYKAAAHMGHPYGQHIYAMVLDLGYYGLPEDSTAAFPWYLRAAQAGYSPAQVAVALAYQDGRGVQANQDEFRRWIAIAAADGDPHAIEIARGERVEPTPQSVKAAVGLVIAAAAVTWILSSGADSSAPTEKEPLECPWPTFSLNAWHTLCQHPYNGEISLNW